MIHYALPEAGGNTSAHEAFRYGDKAIPQLIEELQHLSGLSANQFVAKIVGGGKDVESRVENIQAGDANVAFARKMLSHYGISIVGESVGGEVGRKVIFHIPEGRLQVAKLENRKPLPERKRKVLIVDDSQTIRNLLTRIIQSDPELEVVGTAVNAIEADKLVTKLNPDVITLDIHMPLMTGVEWLETLLPKRSLPVVMISSLQLTEGNEVFRALELGAVDYIQKPSFAEIGELRPIICEKIKAASKAKVIRHTMVTRSLGYAGMDTQMVLALGASTGGTEALKSVLCSLPEKIPPTVIVQHIPPVFSKAFADRMNQLCAFEVKEAEDGDELRPSRVLIAPGGKQMKVEAFAKGYRVKITDDAPVNRHKPSVDYLFDSVASVIGKRSIGVILTGMGNDGAKGLLAMREKGALTVAQDESTSVVYGMPRVAFEIGAAEVVSPLNEVPKHIMNRLSGRKKVA